MKNEHIHPDWERAQKTLAGSGFTCVLCKEDQTYTTTLRGVRPLAQWLNSCTDLRGFRAADKVVGRATAFLYVLLGVKAVYAKVMSKGALEVLAQNGIEAACGQLVDHIINRTGDGICPFEQAVSQITQPNGAWEAIRAKMAQMNIPLE